MNIKKLLEDEFWPDDLKVDQVYSRTHDDHDGEWKGRICVSFDQMGDAYFYTDLQPPLRYRTWGGGGNSLRVRKALVILAEAIRLDNEENPEPRPSLELCNVQTNDNALNSQTSSPLLAEQEEKE